MFTARRGFKLAGPMSAIFAHCADLVRGEQAAPPPERPVADVGGRSAVGLDARPDVGLEDRADVGLDAARSESATAPEGRAEQPMAAVGVLDQEPASPSWIPSQRPRTDEWLPASRRPVGRPAAPVRRPPPVRPRWLSRSLWLSWPDRPRWLTGAAWSRLIRFAGRPGVMVTMLAGLILLVGAGCALMIARDGARQVVRPVDATADPTAGLVVHDLLPASGASLVRAAVPDSAAAGPRGQAPAAAIAAAPEAPAVAGPPDMAPADRKAEGASAPSVAAPARPATAPTPAGAPAAPAQAAPAAPAPAASPPHVATQRPRPSAQQPHAFAPNARSGSSVPARTGAQANSRPAARPSVAHHTPSVQPDTTRASALAGKAEDRDADSADREFEGPSGLGDRGEHRIDRPNGPRDAGGLLDGLTSSLGGGLLGLG